MLSHVIPQCLVTDRITIKLQLTGKSRLIFKLFASGSVNIVEVEEIIRQYSPSLRRITFLV